MTWSYDLGDCDYYGVEIAPKLESVGWLHHEHPMGLGRIQPELFAKLKGFFRDPWQPVAFMGIHACDFCQYEPAALGGKNVFIPGAGFLYVCPELILHYMNCHSYRPPDCFLQALDVCPEMRSREYHRSLLNNGGREVIAYFRSPDKHQELRAPDEAQCWELWRQDDGGNKYLMSRFNCETEASAEMQAFEAPGHKQVYWVARKGHSAT